MKLTPRLAAGLLSMLPLIACSQRPQWHLLPSLPHPISNNAVTSVMHDDGRTTLYTFMGIADPDDNASITSASYRLDLGAKDPAWCPIADTPTLDGFAKIGASAISVGDRVFLLGGYTVEESGERTEKRFFEYLSETDEYVERADVPVEVDDTVLGVYQDRLIYAVSGWHGPTQTNVLDVQLYDTETDTWHAATPMPAPAPGLFGHAGTIIDDTIVICDGVAIKPTESGREFVISNRAFVGRIQADDPTSIAWSGRDAHPGKPTYRAAASQGPAGSGLILLIGGTDNPYNINGVGYDKQPSNPLDQIITFDPSVAQWNTLGADGPWPATMDHRGLVRVGPNSWAIIGGMTGPHMASKECWLLDMD